MGSSTTTCSDPLWERVVVAFGPGPAVGAMAINKADLFLRVFTAMEEDTDVVDEGIVVKLVETLHRAGIVNPNDLGFLCSAGGGVTQSVADRLDPCMPIPSRQLLDLACAGKRVLIPGIIDLAALSIAHAPPPAVGLASTPKQARLALGRCHTLS